MLKKRYVAAAKLVNEDQQYPLLKAVELLKQMPPAKFNESVELSVALNIDVKKNEQLVRGTVTLPHGTGKVRKVLVFCKGEKELQAKKAGADYVAGPDTIQKILDGWIDFDVIIATPDLMREVSKLGRVLGPKGLMPNPKAGTVSDDVVKALEDVKKGKVEFKMDKLAGIHFVIGKLSFTPQQLVENGEAALQAIVRAKPATVKGKLVRALSLSSTMSPGIRLSMENLETELVEA